MPVRRRPDQESFSTRPERSARRGFILGGILGCLTFFGSGCAPHAPEVLPGPESEIVVPPAPRIAVKPYHRSMRDGMRRSFERADEIVIADYTGTYTDGPGGRAYYFDQFRTFNNETWTWGPEMSALLPVLFGDVKPEIIASEEFLSLSPLDKTGICWDDYEGPRVVFLVEGIPTMLFLEHSFNETEQALRRIMIDTYPLTKECRAKDVFDLMLRDRAGKPE